MHWVWSAGNHDERRIAMAVMCKLGGGCCATKGMGIQEKRMLPAVFVGFPVAGDFFLPWF